MQRFVDLQHINTKTCVHTYIHYLVLTHLLFKNALVHVFRGQFGSSIEADSEFGF